MKTIEEISNKLVNAFLKNKLIAPIPTKYVKNINEAQKLRKLCESKITKPIAGFKAAGTGIPVLKKLKENNVTSIVKMASSYKFCVIANGEYDIYAAKERANEWDYAAGHAIAEHAGAIIKTLDGNKFLYGKEDYRNPSILIKRSENLND